MTRHALAPRTVRRRSSGAGKNTVALPVELAPTLRERVLELLARVPVAEAWWTPPAPLRRAPSRCVVCHRDGKLGGHHRRDGEIEWVHKSCHRRLHRRQRAAA